MCKLVDNPKEYSKIATNLTCTVKIYYMRGRTRFTLCKRFRRKFHILPLPVQDEKLHRIHASIMYHL
jgi:hypothetical protein